MIEQFLIEHKIWIDVFLALGVLVFGVLQYSINKRLKDLGDYVAIAAVPNSKINKINLLNTGKINLYLWGFDMPGNNRRFKKPRLIAAEAADVFYYWIDPPLDLMNISDFEFKLYLKDEFNRKWVSEHGGSIDKKEIKKEKKEYVFEVKIWSYRTYKKNWHF